MKTSIILILLLSLLHSYASYSDSTEQKLKEYKELFTKGLINESEYSKLKQDALFNTKPKGHKQDSLIKPKKNYFFITASINNGLGKLLFYTNGTKMSQLKGYYLSNTVLLGFSTHGFSISTGYKNQIYFYKVISDLTDPAGNTIGTGTIKKNYFYSAVPLIFDYKINVFKYKLFITVGGGVEMNIIYKIKYSNGFDPDLKTLNKLSVGIIAQGGLMYSINKRLDIFTNFYYERNVTTAYKSKATISNGSFYPTAIPTSFSDELGINIKF